MRAMFVVYLVLIIGRDRVLRDDRPDPQLMRRFLRNNSLSIVFLLAVPGRALRPGDRGARRLQRQRGTATATRDVARALRRLVGLRRRRHGELAVGVPPVHALDPADGLAAPARLAGVEGARQGRAASRTSGRRSARTRQQNSPKWAKVAGLRRTIYENSLVLVMGRSGSGTWLAQSITGRRAVQRDQLDHHHGPGQLVGVHPAGPTSGTRRSRTGSPSSWRSGSMAILAVYLRQRGSPESKPVGAPHTSTGVEG